jgi:hypothetical protein
MTDQDNPGSHVLYQDFVVPADVANASLSFDYFINNLNGTFATPTTLDFTGVENQQTLVDIITTSADPFSVAPALMSTPCPNPPPSRYWASASPASARGTGGSASSRSAIRRDSISKGRRETALSACGITIGRRTSRCAELPTKQDSLRVASARSQIGLQMRRELFADRGVGW